MSREQVEQPEISLPIIICNVFFFINFKDFKQNYVHKKLILILSSSILNPSGGQITVNRELEI